METLSEKAEQISVALQNKEQGMIPYRNQISPSQYSNYSRCPHKWQLHNRDKHFDASDSVDTAFGHVIHNLIERWVKLRYDEESTKLKDFDFETELVEEIRNEVIRINERWEKKDQGRPNPLSRQDAKSFLEDGKKILKEFQEVCFDLFPNKYVLLSIEEPVAYEIGRNMKFYGLVDIILYDKNKKTIRIIDLKTARRNWSGYKKEDPTLLNQILCYKYFVSKTFLGDEGVDLEDIDVEFIIFNRKGDGKWKDLKYIERYSPRNDKGALNEALQDFQTFRNEVVTPRGFLYDKEYEKRPVEHNCRFCQYSTDFGNGKCDQDGTRFTS